MGKRLIDENFPGLVKCLWPLCLFLTTLSALGFVEAHSLNLRVIKYQNSVELLRERIEQINIQGSDLSLAKDLTALCVDIGELPPFCPSQGVLTEVASSICAFF